MNKMKICFFSYKFLPKKTFNWGRINFYKVSPPPPVFKSDNEYGKFTNWKLINPANK